MDRVFQDRFISVTITSSNTHQVQEKRNITAAEIVLAVDTTKAGKATDCDEMRPEMLKASDQERVLWLTRVCQVAWCSGRTPKDWQNGAIISIHKKGTGVNALNFEASLSLASFETFLP